MKGPDPGLKPQASRRRRGKGARRAVIRRLVIAFSLANLCCLNLWIVLLLDPYHDYLLPRPRAPLDFLSLMALVAILGCLFFAADRLSRRRRPPWAPAFRPVLFLAAILFALNGVRLLYPSRLGLNVLVNAHGLAVVAAALFLGALGLLVLAAKRLRAIAATALFAVQALSPLVIAFFALAAARAISAPSSYPERVTVPLHSPAKNDRRVIVLLFDEMDQAQAFADRDPALRLPELDGFRARSLYATNAFPPAGRTIEAMPSLINGRIVTDVRFAGPADVRLRYEGAAGYISWTAEKNLFMELYAEGFNTALTGWFHPYSRVMDGLNYCRWYPLAASPAGGFLARLLERGRDFLYLLPGARLVLGQRGADQRLHLRNYERMRRDVLALAVDPRYNLVFAHWPVPHPPYIFERRRGRLVGSGGGGSYADNLALVDQTLREVRRKMSKRGLWDKAAVVITSDHWRRTMPNVHFRVPFLVKLPGQRLGLTHDGEFNTVVLHDLVRDLLQGRIAGSRELEAWLSARGSRRGLGYYMKMKI